MSELSDSLRYYDVDYLSGVVTDMIYGSKMTEVADRLDELEKQLAAMTKNYEAQVLLTTSLGNTLVALEEKHKPKVWCCKFAESSRGWNHDSYCENFVVGF